MEFFELQKHNHHFLTTLNIFYGKQENQNSSRSAKTG